MTSTPDLRSQRAALLQRLLPEGVPTLWCPLLTHYADDGRIDFERIGRHLDFLAPSVRGFLVPGSTGDGWQLSDAQADELLAGVVEMAGQRRLALLIGVLKPSGAAMHEAMARHLRWLQQRAGSDDPLTALRAASVAGFTYCAPHGATLTQGDIADMLDSLLATGLPASLYQLPQVTGNRIAPQTVRSLAARHANLLMLKDTSGEDQVAASGLDDLFLVRGAEGGYSRHLKPGGGRYDGFLLSTANGFGPQLAELIGQLRGGRQAEADALSARLEATVNAVFAAAAPLPYGNAFTNANKAIDHFMAHGPGAGSVTPPRLHSGERLPAELIATTGAALEHHHLMPTRGYLND
ncbi:MAG: dihydrodipicolinate synthase family protein [Piscinibacter sp.]